MPMRINIGITGIRRDAPLVAYCMANSNDYAPHIDLA
jgi:hypothetical protein